MKNLNLVSLPHFVSVENLHVDEVEADQASRILQKRRCNASLNQAGIRDQHVL
ncbi:hypothetical protein LAYK3_10400 [Lactobacillus amylovorus subsp. amylovorus]|nr:hypothetical protein LAYK3_10400 [Lactobacillus amylovorus]GMM20993.1 hypothetical protein LAYK10_02950 [Lactobacillus amylovorus]